MLKEKTVCREVKTIVNHEGVIEREEETRVSYLPKEPPYVKLYINDLSRLFDLSPNCNKILYELIKEMNFRGFITITKGTKNRIAESLGTTSATVKNNIKTLTKAGILKHIGFCEYSVNPNLFAKGEWPDIYARRESFQLTINYTYKGKRSIKAKSIKI